MPFKSKAQARACYAIKRSNPKSKWNCDEWSKKTKWSALPEYVKKSGKRSTKKSSKKPTKKSGKRSTKK